ncbi:MAG: ATP-binding protein [Bacteroidales bacterium]|nr:ATP-binding protein [Bacteroidales bacterium]
MRNRTYPKKIVLTGPESTGKTTLSEQLSKEYNTINVPEFAREYIEDIKYKYTFEDVVYIAEKQIKQLIEQNYPGAKDFVFFDTGLIITKIWFLEVFKKVPEFVEEAIRTINVDLYLLCFPDIKWIQDCVRENGGEKRIYLFNKYKKELDLYKFKYFIITGDVNSRFLSAKKYLSSAYCL